jgi:Tol biopolymer transport system component
VYTIAADRTGLRRIADNPRAPSFPFAWAPTGDRIAFEYGRGIRSVAASGSGLVELTDDARGDGTFSWAPDGTRLAYERWRSPYDPDEVLVTSVDGSTDISLTKNGAAGTGPLWSPDGSLVAFSRRTSRGRWDVWVSAADASCARAVTHITRDKDDAIDFSWSPDGLHLAVLQKQQLSVYDRDGTNRRVVAPDLTYLREALWAPNGRHIAVAAGHYEFALYLTDLSGGAAQQLTNGDFADGPAWAPDSSAVVYMAGSPTGFEVHTVDLAGKVTRLTHGFGDYFPKWSPDGSKIAFSREQTPEGHSDIWVMDADGENALNLTRVVPGNDYYYYLEWQP